ncbi:MAG: hypothetical protein LBL76_10225 [Treponema sp.]|jgi:hypothetical protein|nr:hypothetical protein [Treponema sp.]
MIGEKSTVDYNGDLSEKGGSSQELDVYGVWVKSEPQTISDGIPDIADMFNLPDEALAEELLEPDPSAKQQDFIYPLEKREKKEKTGEGSITENLDEDHIRNDGVTADLEDIVIEDFLDASRPVLDSAPPQDSDATFSQEEAPEHVPVVHQTIPSLDQEAGQLLRNILEELTLIRHEVSTLKELVSRRETSPEVFAPKTSDPGEAEDEKVIITGDELTNIFKGASITKDLIPSYTNTAAFVQRIELTDEEPETFSQNDTFEIALIDDPILLKKDTGNAENQGTLPYEESVDLVTEKQVKAAPDELVNKPAVNIKADNFLIDDLLIENGSIKDIPIELSPEDEEEIDLAFNALEALIGTEDEINDETRSDDEPPDDTLGGIGQGSTSDAGFTGEADPPNQEEQNEPADATRTTNHKLINLKQEIKNVLLFMDQLLESLPEDKVGEFAESDYFDTYKKLFNELGIA